MPLKKEKICAKLNRHKNSLIFRKEGSPPLRELHIILFYAFRHWMIITVYIQIVLFIIWSTLLFPFVFINYKNLLFFEIMQFHYNVKLIECVSLRWKYFKTQLIWNIRISQIFDYRRLFGTDGGLLQCINIK